MKFTEEDFVKNWFSKIPEIFDQEKETKAEELLKASEGVIIKNSKGHQL